MTLLLLAIYSALTMVVAYFMVRWGFEEGFDAGVRRDCALAIAMAPALLPAFLVICAYFTVVALLDNLERRRRRRVQRSDP